ncbi:MAG: hypothetical protein MI861_08250, partial [Pirellulales bacterium]|nr:hypothetical protein [Pirellulales bacterium]
MITSRETLRLLGVTSFLLLSSVCAAQVAQGADNRLRDPDTARTSRQRDSLQESRIPVEHARRRQHQVDADAAAVSGRQRQSLVAQAAHGRVINQAPEAPLDGKLVRRDVRQVGYLNDYGGNCGPVCDCGNCDPVCGVEEYYPDEPACGFEVGCGIGSALEMLGPRTCGVEGCLDCGEAVCGVDGLYVEGPACGMEVAGDCSCDACTSASDLDSIPLFLPMLRINWNRYQFFAG